MAKVPEINVPGSI